MNLVGIQRLEVNSLSARPAPITLDDAGTRGELQRQLSKKGLILGTSGRGILYFVRARIGVQPAGRTRSSNLLN
jgi:hypothetical protein